MTSLANNYLKTYYIKIQRVTILTRIYFYFFNLFLTLKVNRKKVINLNFAAKLSQNRDRIIK